MKDEFLLGQARPWQKTGHGQPCGSASGEFSLIPLEAASGEYSPETASSVAPPETASSVTTPEAVSGGGAPSGTLVEHLALPGKNGYVSVSHRFVGLETE